MQSDAIMLTIPKRVLPDERQEHIKEKMEKRYCKQCWGELLLKDLRWFWQWKIRVFCNQECSTEFKKTVKHTDAYKKHMSRKMTWRKITWNDKLKWRIVSKETREKISIAHLWIKHSEETKEKQRQAKLKNPTRYWLWKRNPFVSGEKHPNWKWWTEEWNIKIRHSHEYRNWRRSVYERDEYLCKKCLVIWKYLHCHHIQNFSSEVDLRFDINNWITFCRECHLLFHKIYWRENNNMEQVKKFIHPEKAIKGWRARWTKEKK